MNSELNKLTSFDDWLLIPQYSDIRSRKEIDTSVSLIKNNSEIAKLDIPIISSPMSSITEAYMSNAINHLGGLGIIHRYNTIAFQTKLLNFVYDTKIKSAAIGTNNDYKERLSSLANNGLKIVCIDVAHGDHILVKECIEFVKKEYPDIFIIAGNVATSSGYKRLSSWGADAVRVSIGSGSICTTRIQTGHGVPTIHAIFECQKAKEDILHEGGNPAYIIADGGIKNSGDIVKSLAAGADLVMLGSMLSGTKETPGKVILDKNGKKVKRYSGMASKQAQKDWKGTYSSVEGVSTTVLYKGTVSKIINEIMTNVRSGLSYSGARNLTELKELAVFAKQSSSTSKEGNPHIFY
jgi:IMP dehydrogenase